MAAFPNSSARIHRVALTVDVAGIVWSLKSCFSLLSARGRATGLRQLKALINRLLLQLWLQMLREAWALAIEAMCLIESRRLGERLALARASKQLGIQSARARGLGHKLVWETVKRQNLIDHVLNSVLKPDSVKELSPGVRAFLRLYTCEVKIRKLGSREKAAKVAKTGRSILGWRRLRSVEEALGVLLSVDPKETLKGLSDVERVSYLMFQPSWYVKYCFRLLGRSEALHLFEATLHDMPTYIRVNTLKISAEQLLKKLNGEGICLEKTGLAHTFKVAEKNQPLVRTSSFADGLFSVQDKASCLAVEVAAPEPDMMVLDVCAAPGTKTTHIAQLMGNRGSIFSLDYSPRRLGVWKDETRRIGVKIAVPVVADACSQLPLRNVKFDLVFLDPPCTGTGVFGRMPSSKWRLSKRSTKIMSAIQWRMLTTCSSFVKEGGSIVYSTCSITVEENESLIERFLKWNPQFTPVETKPRIGASGLRGQIHSQRLYPHVHECNGFFIAKLVKQT